MLKLTNLIYLKHYFWMHPCKRIFLDFLTLFGAIKNYLYRKLKNRLAEKINYKLP